MKNIILFTLIMLGTSAQVFAIDKVTLHGVVTDHHSGEPLPGAHIYLPDLKAGAISQLDGSYEIKELPASILTVQISLSGYKLVLVQVDLSQQLEYNFELEETVAELNEVVVSGMSKASERNRTPSPIVSISNLALRQLSATNIIDALTKIPGVFQISTGAGISKPVIRGLGFNRVLVINDGVRQEGQQWGSEHGIEIDEYSVNSVEILKGPASLVYGSDAMAGVINMLSAPSLPEGKIAGSILFNGQTNNGLLGGSGNIRGNKNGFLWDFRLSKKMAHAYQNKYDSFVQNSGFSETTLSGMLGLNKAWGYSHLNFSLYNFSPGIIEGERDSLSGHFIKPEVVNDSTVIDALATNDDFYSYKQLTPYQQIHHYKMVLNNNFLLKKGSLKAILGWQQNQRKEFEEALTPNDYGLFFNMHTLSYDLRYLLRERNHWNISFGMNGMYQNSKNKGHEFLIPDYQLFDLGAYALVRKSWTRLDFSAGLRFDVRSQNGMELWLDSNEVVTIDPNQYDKQLFEGFHSLFSGLSGSAGISYQFNENFFTKVNISKGYRAPNIAELASNGVHEGAQNYVIGSSTLRPENSFQFDFGLGLQSEHVTTELNVFYNYIDNFIFLQKLNSVNGGDSIAEEVPVLKYTSGMANIFGGEFTIDFHPHPLDWLHMEANFSMVNAQQFKQADSMRYLPFTPSPKLSMELRANKKKLSKSVQNAYLKLGFDNYFKQDRYYAAFGTETATPGYFLLNAGLGFDVVSKKRTLFSLYVNASNITDVAYQSHLSRLKYAGFNYATGRQGVFNMGRNVSLKLFIPLEINVKQAAK